MGRPKITVVGAGNVGGTTAQRLAEKDAYDVVLVDIVEGVPQGKALDISQAGPVCGYSTTVVGSNGYEESAGSSIAVVTSGIPRKPGMSRDELLVTNPLDAMVHVARNVSGLPKSRIIGMAGVLDSARMRTFIAQELNVPAPDVEAMVLGGHGDTMVPLPRYTTVKGKPISDLMPKHRLEAIVQRTRDGGAEIVGLLKTGSAFYAPSASAVDMVEAIHKDQKRVMPCAVFCDGEYGLRNVVVGVPVTLGKGGAEQIMVYDLTPDEQKALEASANAVRELCATVDRVMTN
jgi:malate dehydrogenase